MNMKSTIAGALLLAAAGLLVGCSESGKEQAKPIEIVFSTYWPTSYDYLWLPAKHFTEKVEKESGGRVKFKVFHFEFAP